MKQVAIHYLMEDKERIQYQANLERMNAMLNRLMKQCEMSMERKQGIEIKKLLLQLQQNIQTQQKILQQQNRYK